MTSLQEGEADETNDPETDGGAVSGVHGEFLAVASAPKK